MKKKAAKTNAGLPDEPPAKPKKEEVKPKQVAKPKVTASSPPKRITKQPAPPAESLKKKDPVPK